MNIVIALREEIVLLIILLLLFGYCSFGVKRVDMSRFNRLCIAAIIHVILDSVTLVLVNNKSVPFETNRAIHLLFYYSAISFCIMFLSYTLDKVGSILQKRIWMILCSVLWMTYAFAGPFLEFKIVQGDSICYSHGISVIVAFAFAYGIQFVAIFLLLINCKKMDRKSFIVLLQMSVIIILTTTVQIFIPEFLFTGASVTIITLSVFFAIENPSKIYIKKAYIDVDTGVKNRTCFEEDLEKYQHRLQDYDQNNLQIGIVVCDLNGLKHTNDTYGHAVGDMMIRTSAEILQEQMLSAKSIYRTGGDEFVAIYIGENCMNIEKDISNVQIKCRQESTKVPYPISIAMGYATTADDRNLKTVHEISDANMYKNKTQMKEGNPIFNR